MAVPLGILMGSFRRIEAFANPFVSAWRYLPAPAFIPLLLMWFGTGDGGVSRYDGKAFTNFTVEDGLAHTNVLCILEDRQGHLWFGTFGGGISRYDGRVFQTLSRKDGLAHDAVQAILQDRHRRRRHPLPSP